MATITGTPNSETLTGTEFADKISGLGGNDVINALAGHDTLDGGEDNDTLRGGTGNDLIFGGLGRDNLFGELGDDQLFGGGLRDRLLGGEGNDTLDGGTGNDEMRGGTGADIYIVDSAGDQIVELFNEGTDEVRTALASYTLANNVENLTFTGSGNFAGTGNAADNRITGGAGNDALNGADGNDHLIGGAGRDILTGAVGDDTLDGGTNRDKLSGGDGNDTLFGRDFNDTLVGGAGNDTLDGGTGNDTAVFSGAQSDYRIRRIDDKIEVVDLNTADGNDGTDLLSGVEALQFKDGTISPPTVIAAINLSDLNGTNGFILSGDSTGIGSDGTGWSVSDAGDVNGDGFDDVLVGAPFSLYSGPGGEYYYNTGLSYLVFGQANWTGNEIDRVVLDSPEFDDLLGFSVSSAGDVNGDGFTDLIIGAPGRYLPYDNGNQYGQAYVVFGKANWDGASPFDLSTLDGTNGFKLTHGGAYDYAGFSVSLAGDINGDGLDDLIVGVPGEDPGGASYVVFGKTDWTATPQLALEALDGTNGFRLGGVDLGDHSGTSVSSAGDVNGDGLDDLLIGAPNASQSGDAYVVFGKASWTGTPSLDLDTLDGTNGFRITGESGALIGRSVHEAGDVNGDGIVDLIIGAAGAHESYVVFGKTDWAGTPVVDVASLDGENGFRLVGGGYSVSSAGDVNGDGYDDLIIGEPYARNQGEAYVVYGKASWAGAPSLDLATLDGTNGFTLISGPGLERVGFSVSSAGDVNNDGFDDLIVGAPGSSSAACVVFGGNFNNAAVDVSAHAQQVEQELTVSSG